MFLSLKSVAAIVTVALFAAMPEPAQSGVGYYYAAPSAYYAAPVHSGYYGNAGYGGLGYGGLGFGNVGYGGMDYSNYGYSSYQFGGFGYGGFGAQRFHSGVPRYYSPGFSSYRYSSGGHSPSYYSGQDFGASRFNSIYGFGSSRRGW